MPPKKDKSHDAPPPSVIPEVEPPVELPEELAEVPDPIFCLVLGHLFGHRFRVFEPRKPAGTDIEEPQEEAEPLPILDFDPCAKLIARAKEQEEAVLKKVVVVEREELQASATAESTTLPGALRSRLGKERVARSAAKRNRARRRAIEALEAARRTPQEAEPDAAPPMSPVESALAAAREEGAKADFFLLLRDYPSNAEELKELSDADLCSQGLVDLWATVYLAGETLEETDEVQVEPASRVCETPAPVRLFYDSILAASLGSELADCTVCVHRDSQRLLIAEEGQAQGDHIQAAVLNLLTPEVAAKRQFSEWVQKPRRVAIPDIGENRGLDESRLYQRLMGSVDPAHHDVPLFLHCLTEQVECTLGGGAQEQEFTAAFSNLQDYMGTAFDGILTEGGSAAPRAPAKVDEVRTTEQGAESAFAASAVLATPNLVDCVHRLGANDRGGSMVLSKEPVAEAAQRVLTQVRVPGVNRSGLPKDALHSAMQRQALRTRIYPFAPSVSPIEIEHMILLHAFEQLLERAQPERQWCLKDRSHRELIPHEFLAQSLEAALHEEPFMDTAYLPRHDCLLIALHHRSLPGRVMWHSWKGDILTDPDSDRWEDGLFTIPTYNDWSQVLGAGPNAPPDFVLPQPCTLLEGFDARLMGYGGTVEQLATPADGSVILITKTQIGLRCSFPAPTNALPVTLAGEPGAAGEAEPTGDGAESVAAGSVAGMPSSRLAEAGSPAKWDAPSAHGSRSARVMKDGLTFGLIEDASWKWWKQGRKDRWAREVAEAAAAAIAAAAALEGEPEAGAEADLPPGEAAAEEVFKPPFQGAELGTFWLALPNGARLTARMQHERVLGEDCLPRSSAELADETLPPMGVLLTYTMAVGQAIQIFSDGAVRLSWPLALRDGLDASAAAAAVASRESTSEAALSSTARLPAADDKASYFEPGCPEDIETMRTITPFGTLIRRFLSGRVEVWHPDGTIATRNPTGAEVRRQFDDLRQEPGGAASTSRLELLERLCKVYNERHDKPIIRPPTEREKASGLPGHWVVVRPDGFICGRAPVPPQPPPVEELAFKDSDEPLGSGTLAAARTVGSRISDLAPPLLQELLGGVLIEGGKAYEYPITPVSKALQVDLQSQHKTFTNASGLTSFEDPASIQRVNVHTDGTQVVRTEEQRGYEVSISKVPMAHVRCKVSTAASDASMLVVVECADGTRIEVVPQVRASAHADPVPLAPDAEDLLSLSTNASVVLECRSGARVVSVGSGQVDVTTGSGAGGYAALCHKGQLVLNDKEGMVFTLHTDQTLCITDPTADNGLNVGSFEGSAGGDATLQLKAPESPRCAVASKAYRQRGMEGAALPEAAPEPRLFVVHGDGSAEELLPAREANKLIADALEDPQALVVRDQPLCPQMEMCRSHSVFRVRVPDTNVLPPPPSIALPESDGPSVLSVLSQTSQTPPLAATAAIPPVTEYRQFVEYPDLSEEAWRQFRGTLKQYRLWEAESEAKRRAFMLPEPKGKKDAKGKKGDKKDEKGAEKRDKKKKGKNAAVDESAVEIVEVLPEPAFAQDLKLTAFEHLVQVLRFRAGEVPIPSARELLARAQSSQDGEEVRSETAVEPPDVILTEPHAAVDGPASVPPSPAWEVQVPREVSSLSTPVGTPAEPGKASGAAETCTPEALRSVATPQQSTFRPPKRPPTADVEVSFSYFSSEAGLRFLNDSGLLQGDTSRASVEPRPKARPPSGQRATTKKRSPWNPRLVGESDGEQDDREPSPEATQAHSPEAASPDADSNPQSEAGTPHVQFMQTPPSRATTGEKPFSSTRGPIIPEAHEAPTGPHPNKKGASWDVYGEPRPAKPPMSQARVEINTGYVEVEGATDRRVRTSSVAHKKNATKAPSVNAVRKTGTHAVGRTAEIGASEILKDMGVAGGAEEYWKLTSTMQGLGDSQKLVEVAPGACRFGPLRVGSMYRMIIFLRNLDVDVTRFNVVPMKSDFVRMKYDPKPLAPGMATRIAVEIAALQPAKIEQLVEIKLKAHVVSVPVTARIFDAEEFDRLDAESLAINGRRIGRHRERDERNKAGPVELIRDEAYCREVMKDAYQKPPLDFEGD